MGTPIPEDRVAVPNVKGMTVSQTKAVLEERGLFLRATGVTGDYDDMVVAADQSIDPDSPVSRGTVVEVRFVDNSVIDYGYGG
jgi:stage V sporulation protein D (sporulation-specific penicillin-binding protein)